MTITGEKRLICVAFQDVAIENLTPAVVNKLHETHNPCGQRWTVAAQGDHYTLQNQYGGVYLSLSSDKTYLETSANDAQIWDIVEYDATKGYYKLQIPNVGTVASLPSGDDNTQVLVANFQGTHEQWILQDYPSSAASTAAPGCTSRRA